MLIGSERIETELLPLHNLWKLGGALLILVIFFVLALFVDGKEAVKFDYRTGGAEGVSRAGSDIDRCLIEEGRHHLRGDESLPDQPIEGEFVLAKIGANPIRSPIGRRRADRFVRVLGILFRTVGDCLFGQVWRSIMVTDEFANLSKRAVGDAGRVCTHIRDQSHRALAAKFDSLVEALCNLHCLLG